MFFFSRKKQKLHGSKPLTYQIVEGVCEGPGCRCIEERDAQNHQMTNSYEQNIREPSTLAFKPGLVRIVDTEASLSLHFSPFTPVMSWTVQLYFINFFVRSFASKNAKSKLYYDASLRMYCTQNRWNVWDIGRPGPVDRRSDMCTPVIYVSPHTYH